jgi:monoamine oxidase
MAHSLFAKLHRRFGQRRPGAERARIARRMVDRVPPLFPPRAADRSALPLAGARVCVVGGGFAGLAAAWTLVEQWGAAVQLFEASDRVGGRVLSRTDIAAGRVIEAGAELIGLNHPLWLYLARRLGLGMSVLTPEDDYAAAGLEMTLYLDGRLVPPWEQETVYLELDALLKRMTADARAIPDPYRPWTAPRAAEWDAKSVQRWLDEVDPQPGPLCRAAFCTMMENDNVAPISEQSYLGLLALVAGGGFDEAGDALYWTDTEVFRCDSGNQALAWRLRDEICRASGAEGCPGNAPVTLGAQVMGIDIREDSVLVTPHGSPPVPFDYVVLAVPPSLWPTIGITPAIPGEMRMSMGPAVKYLSRLSHRFWIQEGLAPSGMSEPLGEVWEGTDNQMSTGGQEIELSVFAGGRTAGHALQWHAMYPGRPMSEYYAPLISQLYPGYPSASPEGTFVAWPVDRWTEAGYSCPKPGEVRRIGPFLEGMYARRLAFAGEHTCLAFFGYMEGALESGFAAARRIAAAHGVVALGEVPAYPVPMGR